MNEVVFDARPALSRPGPFLGAAVADLARSGPIGWRLFLANLRIRYRRAWLGYLWLLLPALATAAICSFIQSRRLVAIAPTDLPYPVFALAGIILWQTFTDALQMPLQHLASARHTIARSPVPQEALMLAGLLELGLGFSVRLAVLALALLLLSVPVAPSALLLPAGAACLVLLGLALGLFLAPLGLLYEDVGRGLTLVLGFWLFLTPVLYPLPDEGIFAYNPVSSLLDTSRALLLGGGVEARFLLISALAFAGLLIGWVFHRLARPHVAACLG
jgi:lipopolysaccharide transport system permease protein